METSGRTRWSRGRRVLIGAVVAAAGVLVAVPVVAVTSMVSESVRGVVTIVDTADGQREVHWKDYPGVPELDPQQILANPSLEEGERGGRQMMREIEETLTAQLGFGWDMAPTPNGDDVAFPAQNYYGGASMLSTLNVNGRQSTTVPRTWEDKQHVLNIIAEVTARHGYGDLTLDVENTDTSEKDRIYSYGGATPEEAALLTGTVKGPAGQWLTFSITDLSRDRDGRFTEQAKDSTEYGWLPESITFMYGANALLSVSDRAEFEERLEPYAGLARPEPLPS